MKADYKLPDAVLTGILSYNTIKELVAGDQFPYTASRNLFYGRIILEAGDAPVDFENETHETGLVCLNGSGNVTTGGQTFAMDRYDALYVPRDSWITVASDGAFDLAEMSAPVEKQYPLHFVVFNEIRQDSALHLTAGKPPTDAGKNDEPATSGVPSAPADDLSHHAKIINSLHRLNSKMPVMAFVRLAVNKCNH